MHMKIETGMYVVTTYVEKYFLHSGFWLVLNMIQNITLLASTKERNK